jgi:hypothetical protein
MGTAEVRQVDPMDAGQILSLRSIIIGNLLCLVPLLIGITGVALVGLTVYSIFDGDEVPLVNQPWDTFTLRVLSLLVGMAIAAFGFYWSARNTTQISGNYLRRKARRLIKYRADSLVDPDDPDALFVEVVPRENWDRLMLETATDVGFLLIDEYRRQVLFEGDNERLRIPIQSLTLCEIDWTFIGGNEGIKYYFTVLRFQTPKGTREYPFAYRGDLGQLGAEVRERRALALRDRISAL